MPGTTSRHGPSRSPDRSVRPYLLFGLASVVVVVLQTNALFHLPFVPDVALIFCVYLGVAHGSAAAAAGAFLLGSVLDNCSGAPVGSHTLVMSAVFGMAVLLSRTLWTSGVPAMIGLIACAVALKALTTLLLLDDVLVLDVLRSFVVSHVLRDVLGALLLTPPVFALLAATERACVGRGNA